MVNQIYSDTDDVVLFMAMKILYLDDHSGLRESLLFILKKEMSDFEFLAAGNGCEAKKLFLQNTDCSTIILDLQVGEENGLKILSELRKIRPQIRTLVCTAFYEPLKIESVLKMNVQGFITKSSELKEIIAALKAVADGKEYYCTEALSVMKSSFKTDSSDKLQELFKSYKMLSKKEKEIFVELASGFDVTQIALKLGKSVKTVENQRTAVYAKMNIHSSREIMKAGKLLGIMT